MSGRGADTARFADAHFAEVHRALVADPAIQFQLVRPPAPTPMPAWLHTLGEWIGWMIRPVVHALGWLFSWLPAWPWARILLWSVIAVAAAAGAIAMAVERVRHGEWRLPRLPRRRPAAPLAIQDEPLFEAAPARAWLVEADALAALGRFAEAAHLLLFRSVEDLARRRPGAVQPALTARELARATAFPPAVRERFAGIAALVERSLFGGRAVDAAEWQAARAAYAELALPGAWRG